MIFSCLRGFSRACNLKMSNPSKVLLLPDNVRGMKELDREKFLRNISVQVLKLSSNQNLSKILPLCRSYVFKLDNFKLLQNLSEEYLPYDKCIHLHPALVSCWMDISEKHRQSFAEHDITEANLFTKELTLTYENYSYEDIFNAVLPEDQEKVAGFSQNGHIVHLNLRNHLLEYKTLIGTVLIDKIKTCRTVVNKVQVIDNTYRNFKMEVVAGEEDFLVTLKEYYCIYQFDFSKVYWNSRLSEEHGRIREFLRPGDILFDVFSGIGPFAIPAAKKRCRVFANDLNPESYLWLNHNAKLNKVNMNFFKSYNLDGKDFICDIFKDFLIDCCTGKEKITSHKIHVTMNLPDIAVEFLKYFHKLMDDEELVEKFNFEILIYVYCFVTSDVPYETAKQMVIDKGFTATDILNVYDVRNVAPKKEMMRVTVKLSKKVLFGVSTDPDSSGPPAKKQCIDSPSDVNNECFLIF